MADRTGQNMDMDEWDDLPGEAHDLDGGWCEATGDPAVDQSGYQSPTVRRRPDGFVPSSPGRDWLAQAKADQEQRQRRRGEARRQSRPSPRAVRAQSASLEGRGWSATPPEGPPQLPARPGPQHGQHGAYFERRTYRPWYAPWTKRTTWQQISAWQASQPPAGAEVVTVADVSQLPGRVRTIGRVTDSGATEW
jgi:hypothetical protein